MFATIARAIPSVQPVIGKPDLVQADRIHPNARGIEEIVAATVGEVAAAAE